MRKGTPGINLEQLLGLSSFNNYKDGVAVMNHEIMTKSLQLELLHSSHAVKRPDVLPY
ncbi:hypothetical protein BDV36DRAFT_270311 [Aspergillus pseudocaelatus]|uniref:Uncharacterized protein n=1 Tax=Aspergillus pseudocaelatus TaxID=1825620 RepID=A0ABQ6W703_9EURO|nr:hypothetical protein BDV36DRAFT_270311 [Aspergillus pseudocaelatus]